MRFYEVVLFASSALAAQFNSWPETIKAGEPVELTYSPAGVATTILLKKGPSTDLKTVETITSTSTDGKFIWTPPKDLADAKDYAFEIQQEGADPNYTGLISLSGGSAPVASESSSAGYATKESSSAAPSSTKEASSSVEASSTAEATTVKTSLLTSASAVASASGSIVPSAGSNSTISVGTISATAGPTATGNSPPIENTGAASSFGINAAAIFGAIGAFAYLA